MKRKMLVLVVIVLIVVFAYFYTRPQPTLLSVDSIYNATNVGQTVLVNITMSNVANCWGWSVTIAWDPYIAAITTGGPGAIVPATGGAPVDLIEGPFLRKLSTTYFAVSEANNTKGEATLACGFEDKRDAVSGTGVILSINFTIVRLGTTTIEIKPPAGASQTLIVDPKDNLVSHADVKGLLTEKGPPPAWATVSFQISVVATEAVVLGGASVIVYSLAHRAPKKSERRKAELQPILEPEDEREHS